MNLDFYNLDAFLQPEEIALRESIRHFVDERCQPNLAEWYENESLPKELALEFGQIGIFGAELADHGGVSPIGYGLICQELERCDSGLRSFSSVQNSLVIYPIEQYGTPEQKAEWVPRLVAGEAVGCFGLTEPNHGSDPGGIETTARLVNGRWILNGSKAWITNAPICDVAIIWAKTGPNPDSIRGFLVPRGTPGFETAWVKHKLSMRASCTGLIYLNDCAIPEENQLPGAEGLRGPLRCLTEARYGICWGVVGAMLSCYETAQAYSRSRIQFGQPIGRFQLIQEGLVEIITSLVASQLMAFQLGQLKSRGLLRHPQVSLAKRHNVAAARQVAARARSILGANGITLDYPPMRVMANLETVYTYEGTHEIHTLIVAEDLAKD
ncbi:MAG TPA: acyl-CoA dehydrogenase family protein [Chloroflexota bacterium]|nr:acyl-CoA dehydrogenase family protein [Chloroflexota bacterium]